MFFNISNHPSKYWDEKQLSAAQWLAGEVVDIQPPEIHPEASTDDIESLAQSFAQEISINAKPDDVFHVMTEMTFTFALVQLLQMAGFRCIASTTTRDVVYDDEGNKTSQFCFVRFRDYGCKMISIKVDNIEK